MKRIFEKMQIGINETTRDLIRYLLLIGITIFVGQSLLLIVADAVNEMGGHFPLVHAGNVQYYISTAVLLSNLIFWLFLLFTKPINTTMDLLNNIQDYLSSNLNELKNTLKIRDELLKDDLDLPKWYFTEVAKNSISIPELNKSVTHVDLDEMYSTYTRVFLREIKIDDFKTSIKELHEIIPIFKSLTTLEIETGCYIVEVDFNESKG